MGKKYIIDLNPDCVEGEYLRIPARIAGEEQWLVTKAALTPYTEPDLEQIRKEAYQKGYETGYEDGYNEPGKNQQEAYQRGLNDAWEAARKIVLSREDGGLFGYEERKAVFGCGNYMALKTFLAPEAIEKIRQYEQEEDRQARIEFNCEEIKDVLNTTVKECNVSLDEIASVLEKMRGEQDG